MKALFCYDGPLYVDKFGHYYDSSLNDQMFSRYLQVADELTVLIRTRNINSNDANKMDRLSNSNISVVECPNLSSLSGLLLNFNNAQSIIEKEIYDTDLVFVRLPSIIGYLSVDICKKLNKKYLVEVVGCTWDSYWNYSSKGKLLAPFAMLSMKRRISSAPYVLYVTNQFLQGRYPTKGKWINCSNVELAPMNDEVLERREMHIEQFKPKDKFVIGTAAGLDVPYKGQQYVIQALAELKKEGITNIEYQLIGGGTGEYLKQVAMEKGVDNQVKIIGQMPHERVFTWLDGLDAYVQPSRQEGLPRSVIEAMSRGVPCLGAKTAGIPELLDSSFVFSNGKSEIKEIANLIKQLLGSKDVQLEQARRNYTEAKQYQRNILVERRTKFFESCIRGE